MKRDIEWHQGCLRNMQATLHQNKIQAAIILADVKRLADDCIKYEAQIVVALRRGKSGFDRDRFMPNK